MRQSLANAIRAVPRYVTLKQAQSRPVNTWSGYLSRIQGVNIVDSCLQIAFELMDTTQHVEGSLAECGVYRGGTLLAMALYAKQRGWSKQIYGFDSFQGFDSTVLFDMSLGGEDRPHKKVGGFSDTSVRALKRRIQSLAVDHLVTLVPGYFNDTLSTCVDQWFSFVHLDCDLYESYKDCLAYFYPRLSPGGVILFDEYNDPVYPGCRLAVDEYFGPLPENPRLFTSGNHQRWFVIKESLDSSTSPS